MGAAPICARMSPSAWLGTIQKSEAFALAHRAFWASALAAQAADALRASGSMSPSVSGASAPSPVIWRVIYVAVRAARGLRACIRSRTPAQAGASLKIRAGASCWGQTIQYWIRPIRRLFSLRVTTNGFEQSRR